MKPAVIIFAAVAVLIGFVWLIGAAKERERQVVRDSMAANFEASRMQLTCEHLQKTRPDDPSTQSACDLVKSVSRSSTPD